MCWDCAEPFPGIYYLTFKVIFKDVLETGRHQDGEHRLDFNQALHFLAG